MKKIVIQILIFIILFNYIFAQITFAEEVGDSTSSDTVFSKDNFDQSEDEGTTVGPGGQNYNNNFASSQSTPGAVSGTIAKVLDVIPLLLNQALNSIANSAGFVNFNTTLKQGDEDITDDDFEFLTIEKIVFGKYYLFNVNLFKNSSDLLVTKKDGTEPDINGFTGTLDELRKEVQTWYYIIRLISLVLGLLTLIYIGIRMAISTVAEDQAKYKKMLWGWIQSIIIIVVLPYIMNIVNFAEMLLMDIINSFRNSMLKNGNSSFENEIIRMVYGDLENSGGFSLASKVSVFAIITWAEFKFFMMYIKRVIVVGFLTVISPLITITYSIDKAGDGRAQVFSAWFKEYLINILIQPLQAILYLIFIFSANTIAVSAPSVGIIFLLSLTRAEKIFKTIFNMRDLVSMRTMRFFKKK